jgi:ferrous iron transport protein B
MATLDQLNVGEEVRVVAIHGEKRFRLRLLEMGLTPRTRVSIVRVAPLGDPLTLNVRGSRISIRKAEAANIEVRALTVAMPALGQAGHYRVAIAGNPNTGKSTLFNALTGQNVHVGNYPGITVERVVGSMELSRGTRVELVDVPGTYSVNARSRDEQVAIDELLGNAGAGMPDAVVVVLNATSMERSVYLLLQIQELAIPTLAVVNMLDEAREQGLAIDLEALAEHLEMPAVGVVARDGEGLDELRAALERLLSDPPDPAALSWHWQPSANLEEHLDEVAEHVECLVGKDPPPARRRAAALWCLMSLTRDDDLEGIAEDLRETVLEIRDEMEQHGHDLDLEVTQARYDHIDEDSPQYLSGADERRETRADRIDAVLTHPVKGTLVFLAVMAAVFWAIFELATPLVDLLESGVGGLQGLVAGLLPRGLLSDLLVQGILGGVGAVVVFLPQILILFFLITLLESSGYMARAALVIDRLMMKLGLHGKAFVPMISGYACCVPAILATRTIASRRDRLLTIMVLPLISCSARLPVYTLIIAALFPADRKILGPISLGMTMLFGLYLLSTMLSILAGAVLGKTVLRGQPSPMLLELPPYRLPSLRHVGRVLRDRTLTFLKTAGTVIVVASTVLWALLTFPRDVTPSRDYAAAIARARAAGDADQARRLESSRAAEALEHSYAGRLGKAIEPAIAPLGFDWKIGVGLIGSLAAREVFVATMGLVYGVGSVEDDRKTMLEAMRSARRSDGSSVYTPLTGFSLLVFFMIALQCISTIAVSRQETGSWRWTLFQLVYITALAYLSSLAVYQGGRALGFG